MITVNRHSQQHLRVFWLLLSLAGVAVGQLSPADIFRRVRPSTVLLYAENENGKDAAQGSGFIVAPDRICTNYHVVAGTSKAYAIFSDGSSSPISGVVAESSVKDLIVL